MTASERRDRHALSKKSVKIKGRYREDMKEICRILISEEKKKEHMLVLINLNVS